MDFRIAPLSPLTQNDALNTLTFGNALGTMVAISTSALIRDLIFVLIGRSSAVRCFGA